MSKPKYQPMTEMESPTLTLGDYGCYVVRTTGWACEYTLCRLFEIDAPTIRFVAKSKADDSTYRVKLNSDCNRLTKPVDAPLYFALSKWLEKQIAAGRPHIGVRIIQ